MFTKGRPTKARLISLAVIAVLGCVSCAQETASQKTASVSPPLSSVADADKIRLADPTIIYYNDQYYMYGTERPPQTGFQVLVSDDLHEWSVPKGARNGYALKMGNNVFGDRGFWAPQVFQHNNAWHMAYTASGTIAFAQSDSPLGPFVQDEVKPLKKGQRQIDPFIFKDDDGKIYFYHVRFNKGNHIFVAEIDDGFTGIKEETLTHCITPQRGTWEDTQTFKSAVVAEGATVVKHKNTYYLFYSANNYQSDDYAVGYATSKSPLGPWTRYAGNPIIHKSVIGQDGTGHGDLFVGANDQLYYVFHAHASDTEVHPRATLIVEARFKDVGTGVDVVEIDAGSAFYPFLK